jgi:hypothetical protein
MTVAERPADSIAYHSLFPAWEGSRPLAWFFAEHWLEARNDAGFPTNSRGPDEDVNIYVIHLLCRWACGDPRPGIQPGITPLLRPDLAPTGRRRRRHHYRRQADHRVLALGLLDRGDLVRRRRVGWRLTEAETRARDLAVARHGYEIASSLVGGPGSPDAAVAAVWRKLARHLPDYIHALQTMARRRLGLGARLDDNALQRLLAAG